MKDGWFSKEQVGFWGSIAAVVTAYFKYKTASLKQKEVEMGNEKIGIKETKEVLEGLNVIAEEIISVAKDGIQVKDAAQIVEDLLLKPEFKAKLIAAVDNIKGVPAEIKDLDLVEGVELVKFEYDGVERIIKALKS